MSLFRDEFGTTAIPRKPKKRTSTEGTPTLTVVSHPDPARVGERVFLFELSRETTVQLSRVQLDFVKPGRGLGKPLADPFLSRDPLLFTQLPKNGVRVDPGSGKTHLREAMEPLLSPRDYDQAALKQGVTLVLADRLVLLLHLARPDFQGGYSHFGLVGHSDALMFLGAEIGRVGELNTPVLLRGASGSGKELVARAIHQLGGEQKPLVSVNMGAVPPNLAASELFGAVKGSFTGADRHQQGFFRAAEGGTLFLDEIGEAPVEVQVMLLRALETGEITPVGAQRSVKVTTRLIAATDADLQTKMHDDSFKSPLFHRLAGYEIKVPSLAQRRDDLGRLFFHFAAQELKNINQLNLWERPDPYAEPWLPADLCVRLLNYAWPGNVRQLRNLVRQLVIGCRDQPTLEMTPHLDSLLEEPKDTAPATPAPKSDKRKPADLEPLEVVAVMRRHRWDIKAASDDLGISRGALYLLIDANPHIRKAGDLTEEEINEALAHCDGDMGKSADRLEVSQRALSRRMGVLGMLRA